MYSVASLAHRFGFFSFLTREGPFRRSSSKRTCACPFVSFGVLLSLVILLVSSSTVKSIVSTILTFYLIYLRTFNNLESSSFLDLNLSRIKIEGIKENTIQYKSKQHFSWLAKLKRIQAQTRVDRNQNLHSLFFKSGLRGLIMLRQPKESTNPDLQRNDKSQRIPQT